MAPGDVYYHGGTISTCKRCHKIYTKDPRFAVLEGDDICDDCRKKKL
jgi:hypothetical protein